MKKKSLLEEELYHSFLFFLEQSNHDEESDGYGLILDNTKNKNMASIASVGFGLSSYVIGVENKYITYDEGRKHVINTFKTFINHVDKFNGFYNHFLDIKTANPYKKCEFSTIDTVIFFNGAITCDSYFDEEEVHSLFNKLFDMLDFLPFITKYKDSKVFRMAYNPIVDGDYRGESSSPWIYHWHMYAEQISMYFLAAATDNIDANLAKDLYYGFIRKKGKYNNHEYIYCPTNSLFVYQYSHAWIDFNKIIDSSGFDWFQNSIIATKANKEYCYDNRDRYPILKDSLWGLTACLTPKGYRNQCIEPNDFDDKENHVFGVFPPSGPLGSIPFATDDVKKLLDVLESKYMEAFREYGFTDGITIENDKLWISDYYIGINKGITVLMIDNYLHGTTWKYYMKHPLIKKAIKKLGFRRKN
ncbi:glucoamylase family protein [Candidatus Izemoplasma sp. B36]|uniref:glucoamylase family protein n=1 Tax=Candidatus Izemoplasma sp. B36 TaxID=3242468 RepID=UPI003558F638